MCQVKDCPTDSDVVLRLDSPLEDDPMAVHEVGVCQAHAVAIASQPWAHLDGQLLVGEQLLETGLFAADDYTVTLDGDLHVGGRDEQQVLVELRGTRMGDPEPAALRIVLNRSVARGLADLVQRLTPGG